MIFRLLSSSLPFEPLPFIEQLTNTKLLGIYISATLSAAAHVEHILSVGNQRMYLPVLAQLKSQGLSRNALHNFLGFNKILSNVFQIQITLKKQLKNKKYVLKVNKIQNTLHIKYFKYVGLFHLA